jgi:hypothetical protein
MGWIVGGSLAGIQVTQPTPIWPSHNKSIDKNSKVFGIGQLLSPTNNNAIQEQIDLNGIV